MQARTGLFKSALGLFVLSIVSAAPPAFSQVSSQQTIARKIKGKIAAKYPDLAKQYQLSGKVKVEVVVSPDGSVKSAHILGGSPLLAGAAVEAVKQWRYESGSKETLETVDFDFENASK
ncbi:MAG: energy transducer TonB [Candidatus Acidiferrales bacterium]